VAVVALVAVAVVKTGGLALGAVAKIGKVGKATKAISSIAQKSKLAKAGVNSAKGAYNMGLMRIGVQAGTDLVNGEFSGWEAYGRAFLEGAKTGAILGPIFIPAFNELFGLSVFQNSPYLKHLTMGAFGSVFDAGTQVWEMIRYGDEFDWERNRDAFVFMAVFSCFSSLWDNTIDKPRTPRARMRQNAIRGEAYSQNELKKTLRVSTDTQREITLKTHKGTKVRVDSIGIGKNSGKLIIQEYKSSPTAQFTKNQKKGFPELESGGGVVVGKGKGIFEGGYKIPPTKVEVKRPSKQFNPPNENIIAPPQIELKREEN